MNLSRRTLLVSNILSLIVIAGLIYYKQNDNLESVEITRDTNDKYEFINPILDYDNIRIKETTIFTGSVESLIDRLKREYNISLASVYYRDLNNGQWIGVREKTEFASASLTKLPILISFLKQVESDPEVLKQQVMILPEDENRGLTQLIKPTEQVKVGETYTLIELAQRMIMYSDNTAAATVERNIDEDFRKEVFSFVGVDYDPGNDEIMLDTKEYSAFYRILFNSSYLSRENSEWALRLLSQTNFDDGLVAGVPEGVVVSHKFGERSIFLDTILFERQLHDCGIVYYPDHPYLLCIMTRGKDLTEESKFISEVSKSIYNEVKKSLDKQQ